MAQPEHQIWFFGDISDPWAASIAGALPASHGVALIDCAAELPRQPFDLPAPRLVVVHRQRLCAGDPAWLKDWRAPDRPEPSPSLILCVGPYLRYEELERYSGLVDLVLSEATASDVLPRHASRLLDGRPARPPRSAAAPSLRVLVASSNAELAATVAEACAGAGFRVEQADDHVVGEIPRERTRKPTSPVRERLITVWDVPVLEDWSGRLERQARHTGPVVALMGFPDRNSVALAKSSGAIACLELPLNLDDLVDVLDRAAQAPPRVPRTTPQRIEPPHVLPPPPRRRVRQWPPTAQTPTIERPDRRRRSQDPTTDH